MKATDMSDPYDEIIHYDARNGYKDSLEAYLKHKPESINKLYEFGESKWTLLLAACYYQHESIVYMLVSHFKVDIEVQGTIIVKKKNNTTQIVEGASPLWTAAAIDNFNIVKFLVVYGLANVNHLTKEHSTPLRAACYNGNLEMVQFLVENGANPHQLRIDKETNLMLVVFHQYMNLITYFVDNLKCDLNQQNSDGSTALHCAVECWSLPITKFLLSRGALNLRNISKNVTPLMWAALYGKTDFVVAFDGYCSDVEWIEARELLASVFAGCKPSLEDMNMAIEYLTHAFEARTTKNISKSCSVQTLNVFNHRRECETLDEFNQLLSNGSRETLYIEALLIQERVLGTDSLIYHKSLRRIGYAFAARNQYDACLRLWFYGLDLRRRHNILFHKKDLRIFVCLFDHMLEMGKAQLYINEICKILTILTEELSSIYDAEIFDYNLVTLLYLITISAHLLSKQDEMDQNQKLSIEDGQILLKHIRSIVNKKYTSYGLGSSLLHLCCDENTESPDSIINYPCLKTVRLLIFCGIDVDAMDLEQNTALHILVRNSLRSDITTDIIDFLCDQAGAHMDFANNNGDSPVHLHKPLTFSRLKKLRRLKQKMGVTSLKCRCARLVKYGRLPYQHFLSSALVNFVHKH